MDTWQPITHVDYSVLQKVKASSAFAVFNFLFTVNKFWKRITKLSSLSRKGF